MTAGANNNFAPLPLLLLLTLTTTTTLLRTYCYCSAQKAAGDGATPCPVHLSVAVPRAEAVHLEDGSLVHGDRLYPPGSHWLEEQQQQQQRQRQGSGNDTLEEDEDEDDNGSEDTRTLRACPCLLPSSSSTSAAAAATSTTPCLRKCCAHGQMLRRRPGPEGDPRPPGDERCLPLDPRRDAGELALAEDRLAEDARVQLAGTTASGSAAGGGGGGSVRLEHGYTLVPSPSCAPGLVMMDLEPEAYPEDAYLLQRNGSLWLASLGLLPVGGFCLDLRENAVDGEDDDNNNGTNKSAKSAGLVVIACVEPDGGGGAVGHREGEVDAELVTPIAVWIGYFLSLPFLACTFLVYAAIPELRNIYGRTLMCYVFALMMAYTSISVANFFFYGTGCFVIAYIVHFSFLASFFWLNVMCFDIWWTFGGFRSLYGSAQQRDRKKFIIYSIYAWGCASIITIVCMIMDLAPNIPASFIKPEFGKGTCWFPNPQARFLYFYMPMGATIICNICLFILTAFKILRHKKDTERHLRGSESKRHDDNKHWFNLYLKLFIVMGINWSMEIISWLLERKVPQYVFYIPDLANTLQGVIIFVIFVWKEKIRRLLMRRFGWNQGQGFLSRHSTSRSRCTTSTASRTTGLNATTVATTAANTAAAAAAANAGATPLQDKARQNLYYTDTYRARGERGGGGGDLSGMVTDESDCM